MPRDVNALNILWIAMHALLGMDRPRYLTKDYGNAAPSASRNSVTGDGPPPQSGAVSRRKPRSGRPAGREQWEDEDEVDEVEEEDEEEEDDDDDEVDEEEDDGTEQQEQLTREQKRQRVREQEQLEREQEQQARERRKLERAQRAQHRG